MNESLIFKEVVVEFNESNEQVEPIWKYDPFSCWIYPDTLKFIFTAAFYDRAKEFMNTRAANKVIYLAKETHFLNSAPSISDTQTNEEINFMDIIWLLDGDIVGSLTLGDYIFVDELPMSLNIAFPNLEKLRIISMKNLTTRLVVRFISHSPNLKSICVEGEHSFSREWIEALEDLSWKAVIDLGALSYSDIYHHIVDTFFTGDFSISNEEMSCSQENITEITDRLSEM